MRSFRLNDEANLNVLDSAFARRQREIFEADWKRAQPVTLAQWQQRSLRERAAEKLALLLRSQL